MYRVIKTRKDLLDALCADTTANIEIQAHGKPRRGILQSVQRESGDGRSFLVHLNVDGKSEVVFWKAPN